MKNIYLVGFMGTGKTTVGKILAEKLGKEFKEMDEIIETRQGRKIKDIFAREGEEYFRDLETNLLNEISLSSDLVVSCGGGIVCRRRSLEKLQDSGFVFSLSASPAAILERTRKCGGRPLLNVNDPLAQINRLLKKRQAYYNQAGTTINTDSLCPDEVAGRILALLENG